ncbi:MAG: hypothetical protein IPO00_07270 [Betaproteobacteria bacterium]|jgi:hypothetical protein|nr:hypothetical protein [Betaproteobacteria bacterium]
MSSDDIVSRADSLMRRRRSFVAGAAPGLIALEPPEEADIPVLTEEVMPEMPAASMSRQRFDETMAAQLASEFAHALERRLATELPSMVEASLAVLEADLRRGILDTADAAIKDFLARREQLRLPLDEPNKAG